ncbi:uncharacterized protein BDZ99DRAFT_518337 [Mytilinidion resinicola]|uniref:RNase H type-1 domain-containing protein n=1 Tax=Mytilinidion resinicola TaxID=574789 RepID=A0A6A6YWZ5_9PEZI|nr:uncharacterized protein BDZ99DRAFT_518337 [Mytilinidion resinicola]KAF2812505.1 hypothetical protein BDZ99DRAFT_518337 [Mytilinidion resinicola]
MAQMAARTESLLDKLPHLRELEHAVKKTTNPVGALCCIFEAGVDKQATNIDHFLDVLETIGCDSPLWSEVQEEKWARGLTDRSSSTEGTILDGLSCALKDTQRENPLRDEYRETDAELLETLRRTRNRQRHGKKTTPDNSLPSSPRQRKRKIQELWHALLDEGDIEYIHGLRNSETFKNGLTNNVFIDEHATIAKKHAVIGKNVFWTDASTQINGLSAVAVAYSPVNSLYLATTPANAGYGHTSDSAETYGVLCALHVAESLLRQDNEWREAMGSDVLVIQCDSQNALRQIGACTAEQGSPIRYFIKKIVEAVYRIYELGLKVEFRWVPGHKGVTGNEVADRAAKNARMQYEQEASAQSEYLQAQYAHLQGQVKQLQGQHEYLQEANAQYEYLEAQYVHVQGQVEYLRDRYVHVPEASARYEYLQDQYVHVQDRIEDLQVRHGRLQAASEAAAVAQAVAGQAAVQWHVPGTYSVYGELQMFYTQF